MVRIVKCVDFVLAWRQGFLGGLSDGVVQWSVIDSDVALLDRIKCVIEG